MSGDAGHLVRPARAGDLAALLALARQTGGGFTNLPPDEAALADRLARSAAAFARTDDAPGPDLYLLVLEEAATGAILGTAQLHGSVGQQRPFYSYRRGRLSQYSAELDRLYRAETLTLTTDYEGASEIGGLFLLPEARAAGLGGLLARSRYLFVRRHRARFGERLIAELRGMVDAAGDSPFWAALGQRFFGMGFREADEYNAVHGHQFIADLMPKHPIYVAMLPPDAQAAIGAPHAAGHGAMRLLEAEGFVDEGYVDIFDGGPTFAAATDRVRTIAGAVEAEIAAVGDAVDGPRRLAAAGRLDAFRCTLAAVSGRGRATLDAAAAARLGVGPGDVLLHADP